MQEIQAEKESCRGAEAEAGDRRVYSVLLVDDEEDVIETIIRKINWAELGFSVMGHAHNGQEALEMAQQHIPDVIMTDIQMPYMDGLELSEKMKELSPMVKIIIFSGFDEFEYAKEAIRLEAEEYILKPIDGKELRRVFVRIHESLEQEMDERQNIHRLKQYYEASLPILQENFLSQLMERPLRHPELEMRLLDYQIDLSGPCYSVMDLHISEHLIPEGINPLLITMSVRGLMEERIQKHWRARYFNYQGDIVGIFQLKSEEEMLNLTDELDTLCRIVHHFCQATISIGIGRVVSELSLLPLSYAGAADALSYRVLYGRGRAIHIREIAPEAHENESGQNILNRNELLLPVFSAIRMKDPPAVREAVEKYLLLALPEHLSLSDYRFFLMEITTELHRFLLENRLDAGESFGDEDVYEKLQSMDRTELQRWLTETALKLQDIIQSHRENSTRSFVKKAVLYVREHYMDSDLSIERICDVLHVSAAYFSTIFKREEGKTFIQYLTDYRMMHAEKLLLSSDEKTYLISQKVGYQDPNYFSYAFKKKYGVSPSKYRQLEGKPV